MSKEDLFNKTYPDTKAGALEALKYLADPRLYDVVAAGKRCKLVPGDVSGMWVARATSTKYTNGVLDDPKAVLALYLKGYTYPTQTNDFECDEEFFEE